MAKSENKSNKMTLAIIVVAFLVLGGLVYYAWNTTPETTKETSNSSTSTTQSTAEVDKLGTKEVKLTPDNFDSTTKNNKLVLVDVYSPTCPHCQKIAPVLTALSEEYGDKLVVGKMSVAVNENREFILKYDTSFQYVPAIYIYKNGERVESLTGERTKDQFKALIEKYL